MPARRPRRLVSGRSMQWAHVITRPGAIMDPPKRCWPPYVSDTCHGYSCTVHQRKHYNFLIIVGMDSRIIRVCLSGFSAIVQEWMESIIENWPSKLNL